ncbi:MAG: FMN-binding protein [Candidatus Omnitrophota bacterium]
MKNILNGSIVRMITALTVVGVISGVFLVFVYNYSMPRIKINISRETETSIKNIFPEADKIIPAAEKDVYTVEDSSGALLGYALLAEGNGYQGVIKLIVGVSPDLTRTHGMEVLDSQETPGLGAEIAGDNFRKQFQGLDITRDIEYVKNQKPQKPYQIEAITGATISSRAVVTIMNKRIDEVKKAMLK